MTAAPTGRITVTGATGTLGTALVRELAGRGHRPLALVRPGRGGAVAGPADPIEADLGDGGPEAVRRLAGALTGTRALFLLTPFHPRQDLLQRTVIEAAAVAGVAHVVKLSALGADPDSPVLVHRQHGLAEQALADRCPGHTVLRPNAFTQNAAQWLGTIESRGAVLLPVGPARVSMVDVRDIAAAAATLLTGPPGRGEVYELTGPRALGYAEAAEELTVASGREIRYLDVSEDEARRAMLGAGVPAWAVAARLQLYATYAAGEAEKVTGALRELTGRPPRPFGDFARSLAERIRALPAPGTAEAAR
ncbi:NmrA family NAD(P)-binding protein [Streptomyces sp. CS057]|uniref:NmrA family NAD(P)-binding protein n=1 Tax=Streptomyces sp. CS057 TaxID=1982764 RepID=UPI000B4179BB|nr:NAD(P)H-binding protein [Streptomyces sp. CS057]OWA20949.1 hypothetical protein B9W61_26190 [Streptomyces sp. CS057]